MNERLRQYALLMRLHKPIGMLLLLWPMLWALWIASAGHPDARVLVVFVLGVVLMRSAGCVINDYADRAIDPHVRRTRERPIATGRVTPREALVLFVVLCLTSFVLVLLMNRLTIQLSLVGALLAVTYPFTKRYTHFPQVYLGAAFGWAVPMVFAAQTGAVPLIAWLLFGANVLWATVYDTMYAMVDREDDLRIGVRSTAILFGAADRRMIALLQVMLMACLVWVGVRAGLGWFYCAGLGAAVGFALYQQYLLRERRPERCFQAFLNNNWFGIAVFLGIAMDYLSR